MRRVGGVALAVGFGGAAQTFLGRRNIDIGNAQGLMRMNTVMGGKQDGRRCTVHCYCFYLLSKHDVETEIRQASPASYLGMPASIISIMAMKARSSSYSPSLPRALLHRPFAVSSPRSLHPPHHLHLKYSPNHHLQILRERVTPALADRF